MISLESNKLSSLKFLRTFTDESFFSSVCSLFFLSSFLLCSELIQLCLSLSFSVGFSVSLADSSFLRTRTGIRISRISSSFNINTDKTFEHVFDILATSADPLVTLVKVLVGGSLLSDTNEGPVDSCYKVPCIVSNVSESTSQGVECSGNIFTETISILDSEAQKATSRVKKFAEESLESPFLAPGKCEVLALPNDYSTAVYGNSQYVH